MINRICSHLAAVLILNAWFVGTVAAQSADVVTELTQARRVYVPIDDLNVVVERDKQGVMLSKVKFDELLAGARANLEKNPAPRGNDLVLVSADYAAQIVGDQLVISVTAEINQFDSNWTETRFPLQRLSLETASLDGAPAMIGRHQDGSVSLFSSGRGKHNLKLQLSTELTAQGSDQVAAFSMLRAPTGALTLSLPAGKRLLIGNLQLERPKPLDQPADYRVSVGGTGGVQLRITDRASENTADSLMFASTGYGLHVAPGEVTWQALTTVQVFGKPVGKLTFSVPKALEIADVEATGLEGWSLSDDASSPGRTTISLTFGRAFDSGRKIVFKGVMAAETGKPWAVPTLQISNVTSHVGQIVVQHPAGVRLRVEEANGVRRATNEQKPSTDMPDDIAKLAASEFLRYDIWQPDFSLKIATQPKQREVHAAIAAVLDINATGLELQTALTVESRFAPLFDVDLRLPSEWQIVTATRDNEPLSWQTVPVSEPGINQFRVTLNAPAAANSKVLLRLSLRRDVDGWPVESQPLTVNLPELILPQASLTEGAFVIRGDDDLDIEAADIKGLDPQPLKAEFERLRFQSQDTRYSGKLKISRKPSRVAVQTVTFGRIDPQTFHAFLQAVVEVRGGGVRSVDVALPESVGTSIRFICPIPQIVEQKPIATQNGERIWTLQFDQRLRGQALIACDIELPHTENGQFAVPQFRFVGAERQNGFLAAEAGGEQRLTVVAKGADGQDLAEVDPLDLPNVYYQPKERVVAVLRSVAPGSTFALTEQKFEKLPIPTAICPKLQMSTILGRTGELQHRAHFQLNLTGVQGLHVTLPKDSVLWATTMNGSPVEVRRNGDVYLIPVGSNPAPTPSPAAVVARPADSYVLQLFYRSRIESVSRFGTLDQSPPTLTVESGKGTALPVEVLEQAWDLHYPEETRIVESHSAMEPEQPLDDISLLGNWNSNLTPANLSRIGDRAIVIAGALFIIGLFWLQSRNKQLRIVETMIAIAIIALLIALIMPAVQQAREASPKARRAAEQRASAELPIPSFGQGELPKPAPAIGVDMQAGTNLTMQQMEPAPEAPASDVLSKSDEKEESQTIVGLAAPRKFGVAQADPQKNEGDADQKEGGERAGLPLRGRGMPLGLLSLGIEFNPPSGSQSKSFRYLGSDPATAGIPLDVNFVDRQSGATFRVFIVAVVAMIGWFMRKARLVEKIGFATVGIAAPLALAPLLPLTFQILFDGILVGTLLAVCIWLIIGCCCKCASCISCQTKVSSNAVTMFVMAILMVGGSLVAAENEPSGAKAASKDATPTSESKPIPTIVIPYDLGKDPLASDRIFLSHEQYLELYQLAKTDSQALLPDQATGGILEAMYSASLVPAVAPASDATVRINARYALRSFIDGQVLVELPLGPISARDAKLDGKTARLIAESGRLKIAIETPGLHVLDLSFDVPARLAGSAGSFMLPLMPAPTGKLAFQLPAKDLAVRVNGSSTVYRRVTQSDLQSIELPIDKGGNVEIAWQPQQTQGTAAAVMHVDSVQAVVVNDAGIAVSHGFTLRVRQGGIADTTFSFPDTLRLQSINGPDVGGWELQGEGTGRTLKVLFRRNVNDETRLTIDTFLDAKVGNQAASIVVPQIAPKQSSNEIGQIAVFAGNQFSLRADRTESLSQIDGDKFQTQIPVSRPNAAPQFAFRFSKRPYTLSLQLTRQPSLAHATAQQAALVSLRKIQTTTRLRYNLTGAPRSSLSVSLPANFVILDVKATALRDWYTTKQDDGSLLTIELKSPRLDLTEVVVTGFVSRETDAFALKFPVPTDATRMESTAALWLDDGFTGTLDSYMGWRSVDAAQMTAELKAVRLQSVPQFAFASTDIKPGVISLGLKPTTPKLSANGLTMVTVNDVATIYTLALQWQVDSAKADALTLTTPKWLDGKLDFQADGLREATHVDAGNDRTRWTLYFRTPVSGKVFATAIATLPPATTEVLAPAVVFEVEQKPLDSQQQYVLLINSSLSQLSSVDPSLTEAVQKEDLQFVVSKEFIDSATELVRVKSLSTAPRWSLHKFAQQPGLPASVNVADLTSLVARDGTYRGQAIYTIKNRTRQFLALKMPEQTELISVFVSGTPSRAVSAKLPSLNGATAQLIALPKTSGASLSFRVKIVWRGRLPGQLPKSAKLVGEEISIPAPQIVSPQEDPDYGIPVARTRWTVYLPDDLDAHAVRSINKHNLSLSPVFDNLYGEAALQDAGDLVGYLTQAISNSRRSQSKSNLKQMGMAVYNLKQVEQILNSQGFSNDAQFNQKKAEILARASEVQLDAEEESRRSYAYFGKANAVDANQAAVTFQAEGINSGIEIADEQRRTLNEGNGIRSRQITQDATRPVTDFDADAAFDFSLADQVSDDPVPSSRNGTKSMKAKNQKPGEAQETRQELSKSNTINIDELNSVVTSNSSARAMRRSQAIQSQITNNFDNDSTSLFDQNSNGTFNNGISGVKPRIGFNSVGVTNESISGNGNTSVTFGMNPAQVQLDGRTAHPIETPGLNLRMESEKAGQVRGQFEGGGLNFNQAAAPFGMPANAQVAQRAAGAGGGGRRAAADARANASKPMWTQAGGLSLDVELPASGQKLVFTKTGGDPRMTLVVRSRHSVKFGLGIVWSVAWIVFAIAVLSALRRPGQVDRVLKLIPVGILVIGIIGFCVLPDPFNWGCFIAFVIGGLVAVWQNRPASAAI